MIFALYLFSCLLGVFAQEMAHWRSVCNASTDMKYWQKVLVGTILHRAQVFDLLAALRFALLLLLPQYFEEFMANGAVTLGCSQEKVVGDKFR